MNLCPGCFEERERFYPVQVGVGAPQPISLGVCARCVGIYLSIGREAQARAQAAGPNIAGIPLVNSDGSAPNT